MTDPRPGPEAETAAGPSQTASGRLGPVLGALILLSAVFTFNFSCRTLAGPLMPGIKTDLGISHAAAGSMFLAISFGYVIAILFSGFITARITHRSLIGGSNMVLGATLASVGLADSGPMLWLSLFAVGLAGGVYFPSAVATVTTLVQPRLWARGLAIHEMAPALSTVLTPLAAEALLLWTDWRGAVAALGAGTMAMGGLYLLRGRGGRFLGQKPNLAAMRRMLGNPTIWIMGVICGLGVGSGQGSFNMLPLYLMDVAGMNRSEANLLLAASRSLPVAILFMAGWASDKVGHRRMTVFSMIISGLTTIMLGASSGGPLLVSMLFIQPILTAFFFTSVFAYISSSTDEAGRGLVISLTVAMGILVGVGGIPMGLGWLGDHGLFRWGMIGLGGLMLIGAGMGASPIAGRRT